MPPRITAFFVLVCLAFSSMACATQLGLSNDDTAILLPNLGKDINPPLAQQRKYARKHMFIGVAVGLAGAGLALINESNRRPDPNTTGIAIGVSVIGFAYGFYNWMKLGWLAEAESV